MFLSRSVVAGSILVPTLVLSGTNPPQAPEKPHEITEVGHTRNDPFFWLREKDNPEVLKYLEAENRYHRKRFETSRETAGNPLSRNARPNQGKRRFGPRKD